MGIEITLDEVRALEPRIDAHIGKTDFTPYLELGALEAAARWEADYGEPPADDMPELKRAACCFALHRWYSSNVVDLERGQQLDSRAGYWIAEYEKFYDRARETKAEKAGKSKINLKWRG